MLLSLKRLFRINKTYKNLLVLNSFNSQFPKATDIFWQQIDSSKSQVNFILKKKKCTALFDNKGIWLETVTLMSVDNIPKQVQFTLEEQNYTNGFQKIYHIQNSDRSLYEVNLNNGLYSYKLLFNLAGKNIGEVRLYKGD